jgi:hypothetical protein
VKESKVARVDCVESDCSKQTEMERPSSTSGWRTAEIITFLSAFECFKRDIIKIIAHGKFLIYVLSFTRLKCTETRNRFI